ncbi:alpha/beta fold hydrolase [Phaeovulum sp. W22_SRMD_FR3]|uniref:alpha/beta fold hydrolase n=1 Tax=Phaeovulum sp. W22_SRMD_FR3 TaxID=3240274 RepID=UPI003F9A239A
MAASALILLGLLAGATLWRAGARERAAEQAAPPEGQFVTVEGRRVHALVTGTGPDLVLIHGASGSERDFSFDLIPLLAPHYRVIAFDRPGFGWSDPIPEDDTITAQARVLQAAAAALGATRPLVLGHSYGGAVALAWATGHPDHIAGLLALSAASEVWPTDMPFLYKITAPRWGQLITVPLITAWVPESTVSAETAAVFAPQEMPEGYVAHFVPMMSVRRASFALNARQRASLKEEIRAMVPLYPALDLPVEVLHGDADTTVDLDIHARQLAAAIPGARLTVLPGIGHMSQHAAIPAVLAALARLTDRARAEARL